MFQDLPPLTTRPPLPSTKNTSMLMHRNNNKNSAIFMSNNDVRYDGRTPIDTRPVFVKTGVSHSAIGSCYLSHGDSIKILCSIFGPKPTHFKTRVRQQRLGGEHGTLIFEVTFCPFSALGRGRVTRTSGSTGQALRNFQDTNSVEDQASLRLANILVETFQSIILTDKLINSDLNIFVLIVEGFPESALIPSAINCVSMALADGRIPMRDICTAVTVGIFSMPCHEDDKNNDGFKNVVVEAHQQQQEMIYLVDPTEEELANNFRGLVRLGYCPALSVLAYIEGSLSPLDFSMITSALCLAESACCHLGFQLRHQIKQKAVYKKLHEDIEEKATEDLLDILAQQKCTEQHET